MVRLIRAAVVLLFVIFAFPMEGPVANAASANPVNDMLVQSLRQGGYILYIRHGEATIGEDQPNIIWNDCSTQRNLSEEGKRQAVLLGDRLKKLNIPVHIPVQASPFCRTVQSAELAFGQGNVTSNPFWVRVYQLSEPVTEEEQNRTLAGLTSILEQIPPAGSNHVIVAHSFPKNVGLGEIPYMGTVVIKPRGEGNGYEIVGRITLEDWQS